MHILLALAAAGSWGCGNFAMGMVGRRGPARVTVLFSFGAGFVGAAVFMAIQQTPITAHALTWGVVAGLCQGLGWLLFSRAMSVGRIAIVAPVSATVATTGVYCAGLVAGEAVSAVALVGAIVAVVAIALLSRPIEKSKAEEGDSQPHRNIAFLMAVAAGMLFSLQFLALAEAGDDSSGLVMVGSRVAIIVLIGLTLLARPAGRVDYKAVAPIAGLAGLVLLVGDVAYLSALASGPLTTVSVLGGIHPMATVLLARIVAHERLGRIHSAGIVLGLMGTSLVVAA